MERDDRLAAAREWPWARASLFQGLAVADLEAITTRLSVRPFAAGDVLIRQGVWSGQLFILRTGIVQINVVTETGAIKAAFGDWAYKMPVNSTKCVIGHTQGAASAHQVVVLCLTLRDQILHPTINYENPDPECDLDYVPNVAREARVDVTMSNASGFGGAIRRFSSGRFAKGFGRLAKFTGSSPTWSLL